MFLLTINCSTSSVVQTEPGSNGAPDWGTLKGKMGGHGQMVRWWENNGKILWYLRESPGQTTPEHSPVICCISNSDFTKMGENVIIPIKDVDCWAPINQTEVSNRALGTQWLDLIDCRMYRHVSGEPGLFIRSITGFLNGFKQTYWVVTSQVREKSVISGWHGYGALL